MGRKGERGGQVGKNKVGGGGKGGERGVAKRKDGKRLFGGFKKPHRGGGGDLQGFGKKRGGAPAWITERGKGGKRNNSFTYERKKGCGQRAPGGGNFPEKRSTHPIFRGTKGGGRGGEGFFIGGETTSNNRMEGGPLHN